MSATRTGKLLVLHDEYMLSDHGIQQAPDTETFISNIAKLFYRNNGGKFLDYTTYYMTNPTVQGNGLEKILSTPPYSYIRDCAPLLTLDFLSKFEAIFVGGLDVDNQILIDYVKAGGNVCLIAGTGHGGSASSEATGWNQLLGAFGLRLESSYNDITGVRSVTSPSHPLFVGVKNLFQYWGQTVQLLPDSKASIIMTADSQGLIGYAEVPVASPASDSRDTAQEEKRVGFTPAGTRWSVAAMDNNGSVGGYHGTPWEFQAQSMNAGALWVGSYSPIQGSDIKFACEIKHAGAAAATDTFEVVFVTADRFIATKDGALYRFGKKI